MAFPCFEETMKFTAKYTSNWHDTDAHRIVRTGALVRYMQETANRQCEESGLPLDKLRDEKGLGFILGTISLRIFKPLYAYEDFEVRTWCKPARGYTFNRYFEILRDGEIIASAATVWVLIDINEKKMVRAENYEWMHEHFYYDEPVDSEILPKKARILQNVELFSVGTRKIVYSDIDYNMHMNNTHYPDMLCDYLEEMTSEAPAYRVSAMSITYVKESRLGTTLSISRSEKDSLGNILVRTQNNQGEVCLDALVEITEI